MLNGNDAQCSAGNCVAPHKSVGLRAHESPVARGTRLEGYVARMGDITNAQNILVGKPEGKRSLGRTTRRWEDNIKIDLREGRWEGVECIHLSQDRGQWRAVVNTLTSLLVR